MATPLGNLDDLSPRARQVLVECSIWAVEDTRRARHLAGLIGAKPSQVIRCDEYAFKKSSDFLLKLLQSGQNIAYTTDAGVPCISDPGDRLIAAARKNGIRVEGIPGPSAVTLALSLSGFNATPFMFWGFLPKKNSLRREMLKNMFAGEFASVFFESPFRIHKTLQEMCDILPQREVFIGRELTKKFEEHIWGALADVRSNMKQKTIKGEFTIVLSPLIAAKTKRKHINKYKDKADE